ncbi:hybrid sensor histidine kinase/response regulator [Duganella sp. S19_KUP01_CR8]|uniref:hybrid sensor histidine kinase/response regulator n=1 Tax=Duganella sp. S19_KUP01_CR8 TaxID=3025502 RepID=UPI002FCDC294
MDANKIPVLMVDDRPENLKALAALLSDMELDLELVAANSGNEALRQSLKCDFALILLDVQMPEMNGLETAALLRTNPKTCHLPIIFVTAGMNEKNHLFKGYESGAVDYLIKPIEPLVLRSKVRVFCELYAQRMEIEYRKVNLEGMVRERTAELKESELRLRQLNEDLEERVEQRTQELRRAMDQIVESEKLASLGGIVAGVAHELNTPIGNIVMMSSALGERLSDLSKAAAAGTLTKSLLHTSVEECLSASAILVRSGQRAGELIDSFKKVAVDQTSQRRRVFDLRETVGDILHTLGTAMRHAQVCVDLQIPAGIEMDAYPGDLEQIFSNLIMNSIRHGFGAGGGRIMIDARRLREQVEIIYQDDGAGIAPELHRKVFEPFYTTKLGQGGSGLGMFIVHNLAHGVLKGDIKLDSTCGKGVTFTLTVPAVTP